MTALDAKVRATGLIAYRAVIDHAVENGLAAPIEISLDDRGLRVWITSTDADKWVDSIHVDREETPSRFDDREVVHVTGRTPLLGIKVELRFSRPVVAVSAHLRAVTA